MGVIYFRKRMDEGVLDSVYYTLYSIDAAFPEIEYITLKKTDEESNTINKHLIYLNIDTFIKTYTPESYNYIIFKAAHELAHVKCLEIGHTKEFEKIFFDILSQLEETGKYSDNMRKLYELKMYGKKYSSLKK